MLKADSPLVVYIVKSFCRQSLGGNRAGVIILKKHLHPLQMQKIASILNLSETVFLQNEKDHCFNANFYTPNSPIDFCGHASLAAFGVLKELGQVKKGIYHLKTTAGLCEVAIEDTLIFLSTLLPVFGEYISAEEIAPALGIEPEQIKKSNLRPQIVSTGLKDILVPVIDRQTLYSIQPNQELMIDLSKKYDVIGFHVFSLDLPSSLSTAHCRNFAPLYGILEESATGSSNSSLACYLQKQGLFKETEMTLVFKQGDIMNLPSDIYVRLSVRGNDTQKVECGGEIIIEKQRTLDENLL